MRNGNGEITALPVKTSNAVAVIVLLILVKLYSIGATPMPAEEASRVPQPAAAPSTYDWSYALATRLGNPSPSADITAFIGAWAQAENTAASFNPLATTQPMPNATDFNAIGVKNYASREDGLDATVITLQAAYPGYSEIVAGIQSNDVQRAFDGLQRSPWGTNPDVVAQIFNARVTAPMGAKSLVTQAMTVSADFYATGSSAWANQGGMHYGVDFNAAHGSPVYMPFDCAYTMTGYYDDAARMGQYLMCHIVADGYEYYTGHLENVQPFNEGQKIPAGALIGFTNGYDHTHIQLRDASGNLVDFAAYYATH